MKRVEDLGRLALRVEGDWWVAYFAKPNTMDGALELGRLHMSIATDPKFKDRFLALMRDGVGLIVKGVLGAELAWPNEPVTAPEHERSGSA